MYGCLSGNSPIAYPLMRRKHGTLPPAPDYLSPEASRCCRLCRTADHSRLANTLGLEHGDAALNSRFGLGAEPAIFVERRGRLDQLVEKRL